MNRYRITYMRGDKVECDDVYADSFRYNVLADNLVVYFYEKVDDRNEMFSMFNYVISLESIRKGENK